MITQQEKLEIKTTLEDFCNRKGSQNKAANNLKDVSAATISKILNEDWNLVNEVMWRHIANQIGIKNKTWNIVETTSGFSELTKILSDAQENSMVMAVCGEAGSGKTKTAERYADQNKEVFLLSCNEFWNRKLFLQELMRCMGKNPSGDTVGEMMSVIVASLKKMDTPLIIMDEADKLSDQVLYFFITLYNQLEDCCGIVLLATDFLEKKVKRGLRLNKKGYKEIYSRIGRRFINLASVTQNDIIDICMANGVTIKSEIKHVMMDCDNDLRRIKRKCHAINKKRVNN